MPLPWTRRKRERQERVKLAAALLLQVHGRRALVIAKRQSREPWLTAEERSQALEVRREIERRLGVSTQRDTATRYLEE